MFAKLFQAPTQAQQPPPSTQPNVAQQSMASSDVEPRVSVHYGIPSTASVLAFDPIQRLLAIGTLDGRIKVIGGDNIEELLLSPKALPFKNLEFLQNQGFLVSVSNENDIQVWDLEKRCISYYMQWESNITAFSVICGTHFMYVGDEHGFLSVLKYEAEEGNIVHLAYHVPPNVIAGMYVSFRITDLAEGAGISMPDNQSVVGVLSQPCSYGNRVLIAYENGLLVLWDVTEDRAVHVRGYKDLQLKEGMIFNFSNNESHSYLQDTLDDEEAEKEISSLCWVSSDGSVLAVGYVDGDILLWDLAISDTVKDQRIQKSPNDVVKMQLSSKDRRLPVIVLHWSSNKAQNGHVGQLFVYGGEDIGSEEVLTILHLDWSSGLAKLKCVERIDLKLHGSFADMIVVPNSYEEDNSNATSLFILTNPGQLHFYDYSSLSIFKSGRGQNHSTNAVQYYSVIPTVEPYMTVGKLYFIGPERDFLISLSETVLPAKLQSDDMVTGGSKKWPLTGGVCRMPTTEYNRFERIYIGGYQDGSVRIWDATFPVLSLFSVLEFEIKGIEAVGGRASVSALDFSSDNQTLAIGNECGVVFLCKLQGNSPTTVTVVNEAKHEVQRIPQEERNQCNAIFSILNSPVRALQFATCGARVAAGFECGQVAVLDTSSLSVLFVTDCVSSSKSPINSLVFKSYSDAQGKRVNSCDNKTGSEFATEIAFVLTKDAHMVLMDSTTGNMISSQPLEPKENSTAIRMFLLEGKHLLVEGSKKDSVMSSQLIEAQTQPLQTSHQNQSVLRRSEDDMKSNLEDNTLAFQILLCCEDALYFYASESVIQGNNKFVREFKLEKPCSWSTVFMRNGGEYGLIIVYQTGDIEIRSLPGLEMLGSTSMMSLLRWGFKNNMEKTMSASDKGQITLVNGCEFAFVSLLASENEFRIPESLPSLHDKVLAEAADVDITSTINQKKKQSPRPGFVGNLIRGLKGVEQEQDMNNVEARAKLAVHLEGIFSRFPFSDPNDDFDLEEMKLQIDDIDVDEPAPVVLSLQHSGDKMKEKETEREKLFEGGSSDAKPKVRTREEIIAKYRNTGDAASAASQAKDKLIERKEKLEKLGRQTEELQDDAANFADLAKELAKKMEKRKWWNI